MRYSFSSCESQIRVTETIAKEHSGRSKPAHHSHAVRLHQAWQSVFIASGHQRNVKPEQVCVEAQLELDPAEEVATQIEPADYVEEAR